MVIVCIAPPEDSPIVRDGAPELGFESSTLGSAAPGLNSPIDELSAPPSILTYPDESRFWLANIVPPS